ncbi:DnaT-like ssDNA-binding protein [Cupriavidus basilensis]
MCRWPRADAYWAKRAGENWAAAPAQRKEAGLVVATGFVDSNYAWKGARASATQALAWPRRGVVVDGVPAPLDAVPRQVSDAVCELALKALSGDIAPDVMPDVVTETTVGPITKKYAPTKQNGGQKQYAYVDSLLRTLVAGGSSQIRLVRA